MADRLSPAEINVLGIKMQSAFVEFFEALDRLHEEVALSGHDSPKSLSKLSIAANARHVYANLRGAYVEATSKLPMPR